MIHAQKSDEAFSPASWGLRYGWYRRAGEREFGGWTGMDEELAVLLEVAWEVRLSLSLFRCLPLLAYPRPWTGFFQVCFAQ